MSTVFVGNRRRNLFDINFRHGLLISFIVYEYTIPSSLSAHLYSAPSIPAMDSTTR